MANVTKLNKGLSSALLPTDINFTYSASIFQNSNSSLKNKNLLSWFSCSPCFKAIYSTHIVRPFCFVGGVKATKGGVGLNRAKAERCIRKGGLVCTAHFWSHFLAGLIEGDGYITITNEKRVILGITFNIKDKPLAEKLLSYLGKGTIVKRKTNSVELRFSSKKTLCRIIHLINGKFRTPKIDQLYNLIDWINKKYSMDIIKLPLNESSILNDSWLSGFIEADGNFYIRNSLKQIICKFTLEQRMIYPKTNESYNFIISKICLALNVKLNTRFRVKIDKSYYIVRVENQNSIKLLIDYLDIYPLLGSKHLDFLCWKIAFNEIINKNHMTVEGRKIVSEQKTKMNNSRSYFNWDHLNNF